MRAFGRGSSTVLLLHGLVATGDVFGAAYDELGEDHRVLVPDLLGFGRSLDEQRGDFGLEAHLDAIDAALKQAAPETEQLTIGAHSMGSALALAYAARHPEMTRLVACFGAPMHHDAAAVKETVAATGMMARLLITNERMAQAVCRLNCSNRQAAGLLAALVTPELPAAIARSASLHTWEAYHQSLEHLVFDFAWAEHLEQLAVAGIRTTLTWGSEDHIGNPSYADSLLDHSTQSTHIVEGAGHHLPITHAASALEQLLS